MKTPKLGIIGSSGAVGVSLKKRISQHPLFAHHTESISGLSKADPCTWEATISKALEEKDLLFLCVPEEVAKKIIEVRSRIQATTKIIDCSTAHRTHPSWIYGLPEIKKREAITNASLIANPGCHATGIILSAMPLVKAGLTTPQHALHAFSTTGYSGGGVKLIAHFQEEKSPPYAYSVGSPHKHLPEIKQQTGLENVTFQPLVVPYFAGIITDTRIQIKETLSQASLQELFQDFYKDEPFITCKNPAEGKISLNEVEQSMQVHLYPLIQETRVQVLAVLDNLMKGAADSAIQNANLTLGLEETTGLKASYPKGPR